jgi:hypothetical protein
MKMCVRNELLLWIDEKKNSGWDTRWCMGKVLLAYQSTPSKLVPEIPPMVEVVLYLYAAAATYTVTYA